MLLAESLLGTSSAVTPAYIEDVFSTYLYTGNGSTQTITNGIDLSTKGGLVWIKSRDLVNDHLLYDTSRGANNKLITNSTSGAGGAPNQLTSFTTSGFTLGSDGAVNSPNRNLATYASWTFRKQAKFFDVVTFSTNGSGAATFSHSLGSTPGCIFIKRTSGVEQWYAYHRSLTNPNNYYLGLNTTLGETNVGFSWITVSGTSCSINGLFSASSTYVAYLFAHDAGGFGASGSDNVISCGSYNGTSPSTVSVSLGYEPQWVLIKKSSGSTFTDGSASWCIFDNIRGIPTGGADACLYANLSGAENSEGTGNFINVTATGFEVPPTGNLTNQSACSYIYIAIRRGPMKTPTSGTSVFSPIASSAATGTALTTGFPVDMQIFSLRTGTTNKGQTVDRLRGVSSTTTESGAQLITNSTAAETTGSIPTRAWGNTGFQMPSSYGGTSEIFWNFSRAPGFFDVVCFTNPAGNAITVNHNLTVVPELIITKRRSGAELWYVGAASEGWTKAGVLNTTAAFGADTAWNNTNPTSTQFSINLGGAGTTFVAYLFATVAGVSKVGSYTGTGTTKQIDCGFTAGARFVLIKRTDSTGDWYVWDSARGIVAGNDSYLLLNSTAAEVTNTDYVDTYSAGFEISSTAPAAINANGGSFIFLAIA